MSFFHYFPIFFHLAGVGTEMYTEYLSTSFDNMCFSEISEICFMKLKILLIAVELHPNNPDDSKLLINPGNHIKLRHGCLGFFCAQSNREVRRAFFYCQSCHRNVIDPELVRACDCVRKVPMLTNSSANQDRRNNNNIKIINSPELGNLEDISENINNNNNSRITIYNNSTNINTNNSNTNNNNNLSPNIDLHHNINPEPMRYDSTGMFHWCPEQSFDECLMTRDEACQTSLIGHILVCINGDETSTLLGLRNFVMPLRASNFHYHELKEIVFLGNRHFIDREWETIANFPKLKVMNGSPLLRADLRAVNINMCEMCVIIAANQNQIEDPSLQDKECILASLNIKSMEFNEMQGILPGPGGVIIKGITNGINIPMITELVNDVNVQFLDQDDEDDPDTELCKNHENRNKMQQNFLKPLFFHHFCIPDSTFRLWNSIRRFCFRFTSLSNIF